MNSQPLTASIPKLPNENYSYDEIGNRTSDHKSNYRYDATKQFLEEDYKYLYTFDVNCNLTSKQEKGLVGNYENFDYNSENQLMRYSRYVENNLIIDVRYVYDPLERRIEKRVINSEDPNLSTIRRFAYDGNEILFEYNGQNTITHAYTHSTHRTDDVLSVATSSDSFFYTKDGLGSITEVLNEDGGVVQSYKYSSFGEILKIENAFGEDITSAPTIKPYFTYTGREYDSESGLYYYRARYYDSAIGRFLQVDPDAGRLLNPITHVNKYIYVGSNPHNLIDPSGMKWDVGDTLGFSFGGRVYLYYKDKIRNWATEHRKELISVAIVGGASLYQL